MAPGTAAAILLVPEGEEDGHNAQAERALDCAGTLATQPSDTGEANVPDTGPHVLPHPGRRDRSTTGAAGLRGSVRPCRPGEGRDHGARYRPGLARLRPGHRLERTAHRRQRTAPLRLERLLKRAVPPRPRRLWRTAGAPLPDRARPALLTHLRAGHQARPPSPSGGPYHRGRRTGHQGRLL